MPTPDTLKVDASEPTLHQAARTWSPYTMLSTSLRARLRAGWDAFGCNPDLAARLRYELEMALLRTRCATSPGYRRQVRMLRDRRELQVHLGCGNAVLADWVNVDCYPPPRRPGREVLTLDMRRGLPFASGSVNAIFTEHFLEHLPFETVRKVIAPEMRRILKTGGSVRIGVPNGAYFVEQYLACRGGNEDQVFAENRRGSTPMMMLNDISHGFGHYFVYDFETLSMVLAQSGFHDVRQYRPQE
ncbi:MAG TPA: methyltransferase domain-containing protein, partial [Steroidobacteraceae bacterium]|nr:methyltransferase domain-containing protein [Steroidobacteraceae bacterium]